MKNLFLIFAAIFTTFNLCAMARLTAPEIKNLFEKKIEWIEEKKIYYTTATTDDLPQLTTVHLPKTMQEEFNNFFLTIANHEKDLTVLHHIALAIKQGIFYGSNSYEKDSKDWPKCIRAVAESHIKPSFK